MAARSHRLTRRLLDLVGYAVAMTLVVAVGLVPPSLLAGAGLNGVKLGLFVVGVLAFGYATLLLWPSRPDERRAQRPDERPAQRPDGDQGPPGGTTRVTEPTPDGTGDEPREETRFEALVGRVPLFERYEIPPVERFHPGTKLYVASLLMLGVSYAMETVFGVQA